MSIDVNEIADRMESEWVDTNAGMHHKTEQGERVWAYKQPAGVHSASTYNGVQAGAMIALGGKCCQCGEDDWNVLDIDHINGDGKHERGQKNKGNMLKSITRSGHQNKYQLLCANCHRKKTAKDMGYDRNKLKPI